VSEPDQVSVLSADDVRRAVTRVAHEIVERNRGLDGVVLVGLQRGGVWLAELLAATIAEIDPDAPCPPATSTCRCTATTSACDRSARPAPARSRPTSPVPPWCWSTTCSTRGAPSGPRSMRSTTTADPERCNWPCWWIADTASCPSARTSWARTCPRAPTRTWWPPATAWSCGVVRSMKHLLSIDELGVDGPAPTARAQRDHGRGEPASGAQGAGVAGQDRRHAVLRGLHPHPAQLRHGGQATVGRHHDLHRLVVQREQGREPARHRRDHLRHGCRRLRRPTRIQRRAVADQPVDDGQHRERRRRLAPAPHPGAARLLHDP
jgi:hypothetical protein